MTDLEKLEAYKSTARTLRRLLQEIDDLDSLVKRLDSGHELTAGAREAAREQAEQLRAELLHVASGRSAALQEVHEILEHFQGTTRDVLALRFVEGLTIAETAEALGYTSRHITRITNNAL